MVLIRAKKVEDKKKQHAEAQNLAEQMILEVGGHFPVEFVQNEHGKPYLKSPNEHIYVNWSHSGVYILCAVSDREIGVDIQEILKKPSDPLIHRLLNDREKAFLEGCKPEDRSCCFYGYWALKESFLKALGTGFATSLKNFQIGMEEKIPHIEQCVNDRSYACRILDVEEGYVAAICCEGSFDETTIKVEILI